MKDVQIERVGRIGSVPVYRLTVDGRLVLRRAPMRMVVEQLQRQADAEQQLKEAAP